MNSLKIKQIALSLCVVLSLFASSFAACGCSHHQEKIAVDAPSCHQQTAMSSDEMEEMSPADAMIFETTEACVCAQPAPRVFDKSQSVKIEKQSATISTSILVSTELTASFALFEAVDFPKPFYLSDSFYNIKSPRAPPRL